MNNDFDTFTTSSSESESEDETGDDIFMNLTRKEDYEKQSILRAPYHRKSQSITILI